MSKGRIIAGRYRFKQRLGRGNFGVVWEAEELLGGEPIASVAVKVFTAEVDRREIALLADLSHPSILAYRAVVEDDDEICLVTELADGGDAAGRLKVWPDGLPAGDVRAIVRAIAHALAHIHEKGWIHRDVKPANILFVKGTPKLGDVGTARALTSTAKATSTASLAYAAPEFFSGKTGPSVDIYALGCTAYELLTARLPFDGTMSEIVHQHLTAEIVFPNDMPLDLVELILGCTAKEPERRWSLSQILAALDREKPAPKQQAAPVEAAPKPSIPAPQSQQAPAHPSPPPAPPPASPKPTPLDPALQRHLRLYGDRWGDAEPWRLFMQAAAEAAREHRLSERDLIRRAGQLLPKVDAASLKEAEQIAQIRAWVAGLQGRRWTAPAWAELLDRINAPDDEAMARHRDALIARLYPEKVGATRVLDLGGGVHHLLVYTPLAQLHAPTKTKSFDALRSMITPGGVWHSAQPITVREWSTLMAQPIPAGSKPNSVALTTRSLAGAFLSQAQRKFPLDELRWPEMAEYGGMKKLREQAAEQARLESLRRANPLLAALARSGEPRQPQPPSLVAALGKALGKAAVHLLSGINEAWLVESGDSLGSSVELAMNLVSPIPRAGE